MHHADGVSSRDGGKGVNVSRVLDQLGHATLATGFAGGPVGDAILGDLRRAGLPHRFVAPVSACSRTTVVVGDDTQDEATVFNACGEPMTDADWAVSLEAFDELARGSECVVMSGSLPPGVPDDAYAQLCRRTDVTCLVDAAGEALVEAAKTGAAVLLPNEEELREGTGLADPVAGARALVAAGAGAGSRAAPGQSNRCRGRADRSRGRDDRPSLARAPRRGDRLVGRGRGDAGGREVDPETLGHIRSGVVVKEADVDAVGLDW